MDLSGKGVGRLLVLLRLEFQVAKHVPDWALLGGGGLAAGRSLPNLLPVVIAPERASRLEFAIGVLEGGVLETKIFVLSFLLFAIDKFVEGVGEKLVARLGRRGLEGRAKVIVLIHGRCEKARGGR